MIDAHVHVVSPDSSRYPHASEDTAGSHYATAAVSADALLEIIDAESVRRVVLVQAFAAYGFDNRYVADVARAHPERFAFISGVDPFAKDAPAAARHWVDLGSRGLRVIAMSADFDPSCLGPLFGVAGDRGACMCLLAAPVVLGRLTGVLSAFPSVPLVLDHCGLQALSSDRDDLGAPDLVDLARFDNVYLKVSTRVFNQAEGEAPVVIEKLVSRFGSERMLWGSDFPASVGPSSGSSAATAYASTLRIAQEMTSCLNETDRDQILRLTAERLWPVG